MGSLRSKKKVIAATLLVCLAACAVFVLYGSMSFRIVSVVPSFSKEVPTSTTVGKITFNQNIASSPENVMSTMSDPSAIVNRVEIDNNKLFVYFNSLKDGQSYTVEFKDISSVKSKTMKEVKLSFTAKYMDEKDIPKQYTQLQVQKEQDNTPELNDPVLKILPHSTLEYEITSYFGPELDKKQKPVGLLVTVFPTAADDNTGLDKAIDRYKKKALDYVRSNGINPDDYVIIYDVQHT